MRSSSKNGFNVFIVGLITFDCGFDIRFILCFAFPGSWYACVYVTVCPANRLLLPTIICIKITPITLNGSFKILVHSSRRCSGVNRYIGWGDSDDSNDARWFLEFRLLLYLHPLWNSSQNDPGSVCLHHPLPWSQPCRCVMVCIVWNVQVYHTACIVLLFLCSDIQNIIQINVIVYTKCSNRTYGRCVYNIIDDVKLSNRTYTIIHKSVSC